MVRLERTSVDWRIDRQSHRWTKQKKKKKRNCVRKKFPPLHTHTQHKENSGMKQESLRYQPSDLQPDHITNTSGFVFVLSFLSYLHTWSWWSVLVQVFPSLPLLVWSAGLWSRTLCPGPGAITCSWGSWRRESPSRCPTSCGIQPEGQRSLLLRLKGQSGTPVWDLDSSPLKAAQIKPDLTSKDQQGVYGGEFIHSRYS